MSGSWNKRYGTIPKATQEIVIEDFAPTLDIHKPAGKFANIQKRKYKLRYHVDNKFNPTTVIDVYVRSWRRNEWMLLPVSNDRKILWNVWTSQSTNFLWTIDNVWLSIRTNNIIRQTVTNLWNVWIWTTTPLTLFNVQNTPTTNQNVALFKSLNWTGWYAVRWETVNWWWASWVYWELGVWDWVRRSWVRWNSSLSTAPAVTWFSTIVDWTSAYFNERVWVWTQTPNSNLHINGSVANSIAIVTTSTLLNNTHNKIVANNWATNITLTLPNALTCIWRVYEISRYAWSTWTITVVGTGSQIQALWWTVWATTTLWLHWWTWQWLRHSFTAVNIWGVWVRVRL